MPDPIAFLTAMAALSAATQTLVEHLIKRRSTWLDDPKQGTLEKRRQTLVHITAMIVGGVLAYSVDFAPLTHLGMVGHSSLVNALAAGVMVSFGGSLFDEALGAMREFKKAREQVREAVSLGAPTPTDATIRVLGGSVEST